jgi:hypothetical protein
LPELFPDSAPIEKIHYGFVGVEYDTPVFHEVNIGDFHGCVNVIQRFMNHVFVQSGSALLSGSPRYGCPGVPRSVERQAIDAYRLADIFQAFVDRFVE